MSVPKTKGRYDPERGRKDFEDLGGLTQRDLEYLKNRSAEQILRTLGVWFGFHGAIYARDVYEQMTGIALPKNHSAARAGLS